MLLKNKIEQTIFKMIDGEQNVLGDKDKIGRYKGEIGQIYDEFSINFYKIFEVDMV